MVLTTSPSPPSRRRLARLDQGSRPVHLKTATEAQIRYMVADPAGARHASGIEIENSETGNMTVVINVPCRPYAILRSKRSPAPTFLHVRMETEHYFPDILLLIRALGLFLRLLGITKTCP